MEQQATNFGALVTGDKFRFVGCGGKTVWLKTGHGSACIDGQPDQTYNPKIWERVVPTGEWTNLHSN